MQYRHAFRFRVRSLGEPRLRVIPGGWEARPAPPPRGLRGQGARRIDHRCVDFAPRRTTDRVVSGRKSGRPVDGTSPVTERCPSATFGAAFSMWYSGGEPGPGLAAEVADECARLLAATGRRPVPRTATPHPKRLSRRGRDGAARSRRVNLTPSACVTNAVAHIETQSKTVVHTGFLCIPP